MRDGPPEMRGHLTWQTKYSNIHGTENFILGIDRVCVDTQFCRHCRHNPILIMSRP
jgi:hypothetical protein